MSKKSLLMMLLLALLVPWAANAQTRETLTFNFEDQTIPSTWTNDATYPWIVTDASQGSGHNGMYCIKSGNSGVASSSSTISATFEFNDDGTISFLGGCWGEGSSTAWDKCIFSIDGTQQFAYGARDTWETYTFDVTVGSHTFTWSFTKDSSVNATGDAFFVDDIVVALGEVPACPKPTGLNFALTPGDGTVATLSWTSDADAWQICLNGDETNLIPATTNPYTLTGLTPETTYTAKVRTNCGSEQSDWSNEVTFTPTNAYSITVNDGTTTNGYVPIYGTWVDNITKSQFIIPARELADMAWGTINKMTFYAAADKDWGAAQFEVYMTETAETTLSALADYSTMTKVMNSASLGISGNQMVVEFDAPYQYMGGNLMIGFLQTVSGTWSGCSWYGITAEGASMGGYGSSVSQRDFLPKTTFDYEPGEAPACMWPTNLAVSNIGARSVELSWTENGTATNWQICVNGDEANPIAANTNPYTLTGLTPETDYSVKVRAICGTDNYSDWTSDVTFTTDVTCHAPTTLSVSDIEAFSANVNWTGTENTYQLRYVDNPNYFFQGFVTDRGAMADGSDASWLKEGETTYGPGVQQTSSNWLADDFVVNTATALTEIEVYSYQTGSTTESTYTGLYAVIYNGNPAEEGSSIVWGDMETNIMTSTAFTNCYRGSDNDVTGMTRPIMAITASNLNIDLEPGTYWIAYTLTGTLSSGPWGVPYCEPNIGMTGNGMQYLGSSSTWQALENNGKTYGPAMKLMFGDMETFDWTYVNNIEANTYAMTNLEPETPYLVQVRATCGGDDGNSEWATATFTTLPTCMTPTALTVSDIEARQVVLSWTENGDATAWEVEVAGEYTTTWDATTNPYTLVGLEPSTRYTVKVRAKCSETDFSDWSNEVTFTTDVSCYAPTNLAFADITGFSANVSWDGEADSYEMEYATGEASYLTYDFEDGTLQGWTNLIVNTDGGEWLHSNDNGGGYDYTTLAHGGTGFAMCYSFIDNDGSYDTDAYLVSPTSYSIADNASLNFWYDMANDTYPEDFEVCVATVANPTASDFTAIWASGTAKGNNDIWKTTEKRQRNTRYNNWREVTLDLNAYAGQSIWIAFHDVNYDMYEVWIDDITVNTGNELVWTPVGTVTSPYLLNNLDPETTYMVRVRANCGEEDGYSAWLQGSFTTDVACPAPEALAATPYALSAELSWEGTSESYTVRYGIVEIGETIFSEDFAEGIPADWTNDATYPWVVVDGYIQSSNGGEASSSSTISFTLSVSSDAYFDFDAKCMGEGTSSVWDKCIFTLDGTEMFRKGANGEQWDHYRYPITAGTHTFTWSYQKDSSVNPTGDYMAVDNIAIVEKNYVWETTTATTNECTITGLTPLTTYYAQVMGDCGDFGTSQWSEIISFTTAFAQTTTLLGNGTWNRISLYIEVDDPVAMLEALEAQLDVEGIIIETATGSTENFGDGFWWGTIDETGITNEEMLLILIPEGVDNITIELEGVPANPANHEINIVNGSWNRIGFPCTEEVPVEVALADFEAVDGDILEGPNGSAEYYEGMGWWSTFENFVPGEGYLLYSGSGEDRPLIFSTGAKKAHKAK